jgi:hypothetical protein
MKSRSKITTALIGGGTVLLLVFALGGRTIVSSQGVRSIAQFRDASTPLDRIQSDGFGLYIDQNQCVDAYVIGGGSWLLDTARTGCPQQRSVQLDFSDAISRTPDGSGSDTCHVNDAFGQAGELNICGSNAVDLNHLTADRFFGNNANSTKVAIRFNLVADGNQAFSLEFEQPLQVSGDSNTRIMTAGANSVAELYKATRRSKVSLGRFYMPFRLTVTR